ncbi:hypothetical protein [Spirulina sp. 06S082]|nr:hypothetical protein [Spirulina sp. 06S082]MEA5467885.1 hypothetical protein [Spirulina sp. 06S082]
MKSNLVKPEQFLIILALAGLNVFAFLALLNSFQGNSWGLF